MKFHIPRIPGDTIVYPMIVGVLLNSLCPQVLKMGSFFTGVASGTSALVGAFLFFLGASIDIKSTPKAIKKGGVIIITKIALSIILGLIVAFLFNDNFLGLSSLAIIGGISVANNALYSGIVSEYGDDSDKGAVAITSLSVGPTVTMIVLSSAGFYRPDHRLDLAAYFRYFAGQFLPIYEEGLISWCDGQHYRGRLCAWR